MTGLRQIVDRYERRDQNAAILFQPCLLPQLSSCIFQPENQAIVGTNQNTIFQGRLVSGEDIRG